MRLHPRSAAALAALALFACGSAPAWATPATPSWVATWGLPINSSRTTAFSNRTLREVAQTSLGGSQVRVRLSNDNGTGPITLSDLHVGLAGTGAAVSGTNEPLTVAGQPSVTIPAGGSVLTDPVALQVPDGASLAVSVFTAGNTGRGTGDGEIGAYYMATGDHAADTASTSFGARSAGGWFVTGIDVYTPNDGAIVGFGDSITAGYNAGGTGWPYWLSANLVKLAAAGGPRVGIVNMGISGNEVTKDRPSYGVSALHRWQRDVLDQTGVRLVLMMEGINDLGADAVPASSIESAYQTLASETAAAHVNMLVSPLTPSGDPAAPASLYGGDYSTPLGIQIRHDFNSWLRASNLYNPLLDFAAVVQNPSDPDELAAADDSSDHLHPNVTGQQAMANSLNLSSPVFVNAIARPTTTATVSPPVVAGETTNPTVTLTATDDLSTVTSTFYQLDGGPVTTYTAPFVVSTGGYHTLVFWSTDAAGNTESAQTLTFFVNPAVSAPVGGTVPAQLSLSLGTPATFGSFVAGVAQDYFASESATVVSTAGNATLSVSDPSTMATGHLVNGAFSLPQALQVDASSAAGTGGAFAPVGGASAPTTVLTYGGPVSNDAVTVGFKQSIGANDALRTGTYAKTLVFTLATTSP